MQLSHKEVGKYIFSLIVVWKWKDLYEDVVEAAPYITFKAHIISGIQNPQVGHMCNTKNIDETYHQ